MNLIDQRLSTSLLSLSPNCGKTSIIAIDGPAGAGKTTLAREIAERFTDVQIIHMDDLYYGWNDTLTPRLTNTLIEIIDRVRIGESIIYSPFDWASSQITKPLNFPSPKVLILEGVGSGQSAIANYLALSIWIDIPIELGLARVLERDGKEVEPYMGEFIKTQIRHFAKEDTRKRADYRLSGH